MPARVGAVLLVTLAGWSTNIVCAAEQTWEDTHNAFIETYEIPANSGTAIAIKDNILDSTLATNLLIVLFFSSRSAAEAADLASAFISFSREYCNCSIDNTCDEYPCFEKAGLPNSKCNESAHAVDTNRAINNVYLMIFITVFT